MQIKQIDASMLAKMFLAGAKNLESKKEWINELNVFPVPDGDTGTNMTMTIMSAAAEVSNLGENPDMKSLAKAISSGSLRGARGNSGVILSQLFRGFTKGISEHDTIDVVVLCDALQKAVETAYKAVMKPVEGTILTVARVAAQEGASKANDTDDVIEVMKAVVEGAKKALKSTPDLLPVLKQVGVVDSGGQGLLFIYEGFLEGLLGENFADQYQPDENEMDEMINAMHHQSSVQSQLATQDIKNGYCTEIMVDLNADVPNKKKFDLEEFRKHLSSLGDSLLAVSDGEIAKVHVHTEHPGDVFKYGSQFGQLGKIKIDNMRIQHESIVDQDEEQQESVDFAVIAVASGNGIRKLFESEGVNRIISGGQTMNPSTQDFIDAIKKSGAKKAIVLPNNGNIVMAAKQAAEVSDIPVGIVPSKTISQGLTAMLSFNPDASVDDNVEAMSEDLDTVVSGEVTQATRDTEIDDVEIHKNDYIGIVDGSIKVDNPDLIKTTTKMIEKMLDDDSEIITIMYGRDSSEEEAQEVVSQLEEKHDDLEFEIHDGGQPVYHFLVSVE